MVDAITILLVAGGAFFFLAGTVGLLRFPDVFTRLHALAKADNLGLGLVVFALMLQADAWSVRFKLLLIWLLVLGATATTCQIIARAALERGMSHDEQHGNKP
jgi:multicomponent Na+:H+ antiporter subunit G